MFKRVVFVALALSVTSAAQASEWVFKSLNCDISNGVVIESGTASYPGETVPVAAKWGLASRSGWARLWRLMPAGSPSKITVSMDKPVYGDVEDYTLELDLDRDSTELQEVTGKFTKRGGFMMPDYTVGIAKCSVQFSPPQQ